VDKTVYHLSKAQAAAGHRVHVFCLTAKESLSIDGVTVRGFGPCRNPFTLPVALKDAIEEAAPDVVHLHSVFIPQNITLARWLREGQIAYVVTPNGGLASFARGRCSSGLSRTPTGIELHLSTPLTTRRSITCGDTE
jgi:hypothetical protein